MASSLQESAPATGGRGADREVEWQLASENLGSVHRWLTEHDRIDGLVVEPESTLQLCDTYFDTDDWRIHRAGFALRIRTESGRAEATLKSLHAPKNEIADRRELNEVLQGSESEAIRQSSGPVGARVQAVAGAHALQPLFEVRTSRQRFGVRRENDPQQLGEIALDDTIVAHPHGEPKSTLQRVEVEAMTGVHEPLQTLVRTLKAQCALQPVTDSKYALGLRSVGLAPAPPPQFEPTTIDGSMRIDQIAHANLRRYWAAWLAHEPGARLGDDPEALHDLRVAGRRLDAVLRQFDQHLPETLRRFRQPLKKILRVLGEARDYDVALAELDTYSRKLPETARAGVEALQRYLSGERARARARMLTLLDSAAIQQNVQKLTLLLSEAPAAPEVAPEDPASHIAAEMLRARFRKLRKGADRLTSHSSMESFHQVRSRVKKLRYALEAVSVIYGRPADDLVRALRRWQEKLGVQQDAYVASRRLQALAAAPPKSLPSETLFLMGRLAEHYASCASRARKGFTKDHRKVRRRWRDLRGEFEAVGERARQWSY